MSLNPGRILKKAKRLISSLEGKVRTLEADLARCRKGYADLRRTVRDLEKELGR